MTSKQVSYKNISIAKDHYRKKRFEECIEYLNYAIEFNPQWKSAYRYRGKAYHRLNNYESALKDLTMLIQLDPHSSDSWVTRGILYKDYGERVCSLWFNVNWSYL